MDHADPPIPIGNPRISGTEADRQLLSRDRLLDGAGEEFAEAKIGDGYHPVSVRCYGPLVLRNGGFVSVLGAENLTLGKMGNGMAWRCLQHSLDQFRGARDIGLGGLGNLFEHAADERQRH